MSKKTLLKGIIAVSAATTMLFSTAFAANSTYTTSTLYVKGAGTTVEVKTIVNNLTAGDELTYLAGPTANPASDPVYINQYTVPENTTGTEYYTYKTNKSIFNTSIKMAKTDSAFLNGSVVSAATTAEQKIQNAPSFSFIPTLNGTSFTTQGVNPNFFGAQFTLEYVKVPQNHEITSVKVAGTTLAANDYSYNASEEKLTITHGITLTWEGNDFSPKTAAVEITTAEIVVGDPVPPVYVGGYKVDSYEYDFKEESGETTKVTGPMYAVYADASSLPTNATEWGIALSLNKDFDGVSSAWDHYKAATTEKGPYAVAIMESNPDDIPDVVYATTYSMINGIPFYDLDNIITFKLK